MDGFVDAYGVLGVAPTATQAELKAAHRALVRRHHPDLVPPAERSAADRRVRDINVAYELVRDREVRMRYDRLRSLHTARETTARVRLQVDEAELAARWRAMSQAAGRRAGRWVHRGGGLSYRAGRILGRWLG